MQAKCSGTTKTGTACRAPALASGFCVSHDPDRIVQLAEWRKRGGRAKSNRSRAMKDLPDVPMTSADLHRHLGSVFLRVIAGKIEPNVGTSAATIARVMTEIAKTSDIEGRLIDLERRLASRSG